MEGVESSTSLWDRLADQGHAAGIASLGVTGVEPLEPARTVLPLRKRNGLAATMQFTYRNPDRSTDPLRAMPSAASIIVAAWPYERTRQEPTTPDRPEGRVAMYAWRDHYADLRRALDHMAETLRNEGFEARVHLDDNHLVDRNVAYRAGLGWYGKNANLLIPNMGSWFVLGSILTDAELEPAASPLVDGCGPCRRCIDECPTDAIVAPGVVDARRCLAWLVQGPGPIPVEFRSAVGDRIYGCDDCQTACPPNQSQPEAEPLEPDGDPAIDLGWLLRADDDELMARVGRWYIADRDPDIVRRTALVILGNTGSSDDPETTHLIERHLRSDSPLLREHAAWAAAQLGIER